MPGVVVQFFLEPILNVVHEMLEARKYTVYRTSTSNAFIADTIDIDRYNFLHFNPIALGEKGKHTIEVFIAETREKLGVRDIRSLLLYAQLTNLKSLVIITMETMTFFAQRQCKERDSAIDHPDIELWTFKELCFNVTTHHVQPKFTVLANKDKSKLIINSGSKKLAKIMTSDPVARFYGLRKGMIIKIDRGLPGGQTMKSYRIAI